MGDRLYFYKYHMNRRQQYVNESVREGLGRMQRAATVAIKGLFPPYAWPGGYQIVYYDREGSVLCPACAKAEYVAEGTKFTGDIYYEGPDEVCCNCNAAIPSAYGDPNEDED
jgi:hypothetical protein